MGFDLRGWAARPGKRFIYNELGIGGGIDPCKPLPAGSPAEAGLWGWLSTGYPYSKASDPWANPALQVSCGGWGGVTGGGGTRVSAFKWMDTGANGAARRATHASDGRPQPLLHASLCAPTYPPPRRPHPHACRPATPASPGLPPRVARNRAPDAGVRRHQVPHLRRLSLEHPLA
jgi:hypothetical protein